MCLLINHQQFMRMVVVKIYAMDKVELKMRMHK